MKWTVFDLEFTELLPDMGQPLQAGLHISCASIMSSGDVFPQVWYEMQTHTIEPGPFMSQATVDAFVATLAERSASGHTIVTWGGSSSDFKVLAKECPEKEALVRTLDLYSIDIPMCTCLSIGTMMGLNAACAAIGLNLKESGSSKDVPEKWRDLTKRHEVIQHVSNDAFATMSVLDSLLRTSQLNWITKRDQLRSWHISAPKDLWSVRECLAKELPAMPYQILPQFNAKLLARWLLMPAGTSL